MKRIPTPHFLLLTSYFFLSLLPAWARIEMGTPFSDHAVLQRDRAVPVWGKAAPGATVSVSFAGQEKKTVAGADGAWRVDLDPLPASKESRDLTVAETQTPDNSNTQTILHDVLVGEVWFASGQSNMECPIWGGNARFRDGNGALVIEMTKLPQVRYCKNAQAWSVEPKPLKSTWRTMTPENLRNVRFSAIAYYYARELYLALDIPIGIVDSTWGGTNIDAWTPRCGYEGCDPSISNAANWRVTAKWDPKAKTVGPISGAHQQPTVLFNGMVAAWTPMAMRGFIWYQGCHNSEPSEAELYGAKMHALYDGWSRAFENPGLKIYFAQLAPWWSTWMPVVRQQNRFAAEEPNAAIAVTADVGNPWDIHPNQKEIVAKRLAVHALKRDYGFDIAEDDSPVFKSAEFGDGKAILRFDHVKSWYVYAQDMSVKPPFEIADVPGHWFPATIENLQTSSNATTHVVTKHPYLKGTEIVLSAKEVKNPTYVRYLAQRFMSGTLYNEMSLPLGPFECRKPAVTEPMEVVLTFDDGPKDHLEFVAPLLEKHGWRGTFNIPTDWIGRPKHVTWDDVRELRRRGHAIASHTVSHANLVKLLEEGKTNEVRREFRESRETLLRETGRLPRYMCYPYSAANAATDALCREEGLIPMSCARHNFGKGTKAGTPTGVGAALDRWIAQGCRRQDVLVHGPRPGGGWCPFDSEADFIAFLDEIADRERRGLVKVVSYDAFADFPDVSTWHGANLLGMFNAAPKKPDPRVSDRFDERHFRWLKDWGFNFARLPMDYRFLLATNDWTQLRQDGFAKVDEAVAFGRKYGIHVQLCLHRAPGFTIASWVPEATKLQTDKEPQEAFMRIWREFARRYKGIPNSRLSFNLINEPEGFTEQQFIDVFGRTIEAIRAIDPNRFVMLDGNEVAAKPVSHFYKVPYTGQAFRGYTPHAISHYQAWYIKDQPKTEPTWPLDPKMAAEQSWICRSPESTLALYADTRRIGYPVMVGEFGCYNKLRHETCLAWMEHCLGLWQKEGLGWAIWNVDGAFGFLDSNRADADYEDFDGHKLDRKMLDLLKKYSNKETKR